MPHNPHCAGCQICFEYMLIDTDGEEWWNHPDNQLPAFNEAAELVEGMDPDGS